MRGGSRVIIEPHRHEGVFIARGREDALVTKNLVPGETVYGEKKITVEVSVSSYCHLFTTHGITLQHVHYAHVSGDNFFSILWYNVTVQIL